MNPDSIVDFELWLDQQCRDAQRLANASGLNAAERKTRLEIMQRRMLTRRYVKAALLTYGRVCAMVGSNGHVSTKD